MNRERTEAYRRVVETLVDLGPSKLQQDEQERIRLAADTLVFSSDLAGEAGAREALVDVEALCDALVDSGRWHQVPAARLLHDVAACGPAVPVGLQAA